jgi:choline-sulfatase
VPRLLRAVDAAVLAALVAALADLGPALAAGRIGVATFLFAGALLGAVAVALGVAAGAFSLAAPRVDAAMRRPWILPAASAAILVVPLVGALARSLARPGLALVVVVPAAVAVGALAYRRAARAPSPSAWLAGAVAAEQIVFRAAASVNLVERIDPGRLGGHVLLLAGASLGGVVLADLVSDLARAAEDDRRGRWRAGVAAALGAVVLAVALVVYPDLYRAAHRMAYLAAFLLLAAAATRLRLPGKRVPRAVVAAALFAGVAWLTFFLRLPSSVPWELASHARVAREIAGETGLLEGAFRRFVAELRERPEAAAARQPAPPAPARAPSARNVLLLTVDSLRWDHVGYSGSAPAGLTPSLDALAASSVRFRRAYTQGAWTSLALPALFWSRYPKDVRFVPVFEDSELRLWFADEIPSDAVIAHMYQTPRDEPSANLAEILGAVGFETVAVPNDGATRFLEPRVGLVRGFQRVAYPRALVGLGDRTQVAARDEIVAITGADWLARAGERPFFLWLHFFEPHAPHDMGGGGGGRSSYEAEVAYTDAQIGRVLAALHSSPHDASTLVVFTSDHGELFSRSAPQAGIHGIDLRETLVHVPLLVRAPGVAPRDVEDTVALVDVAPTVLGALGVAAAPTMQGRDLSPLLGGAALPARPAYLETWYLEAGSGRRMLHQIGATSGALKVVMDLRSYGVAFFDLAADPREERNLFGTGDGARFAGLAASLIGWYGL